MIIIIICHFPNYLMLLDDNCLEEICNQKTAFWLYFFIVSSLHAIKIAVGEFKISIQEENTFALNLEGGNSFPRDLQIIYS